MSLFIQIGATRDGLDPYLQVAHAHDMQAILIETPDYIHYRQKLAHQEFDQILPVVHPADPSEVIDALQALPTLPTLLLAGFERYSSSSYIVANTLHTLPYRPGATFIPLDKAQQRTLLTRHQAPVPQPRYLLLGDYPLSEQAVAHLSYPLVVKPVDGGGGLAVFLAHTYAELLDALTELNITANYDGGPFAGTLIEEYIPGEEYSIQGLARDGVSDILTFSKKFTTTELVHGTFGASLHGFREVGHIAGSGAYIATAIQQFAQSCVTTFGYQNGPFHIDLVQSAGTYFFLEMGFRLSGIGIARLVQRVSGRNWAEEVFVAHLSLPTSQPASPAELYLGQLTARNEHEIQRARQLQSQDYPVEVQLFNHPSTRTASPRLAADLARHSGTLGRITVYASTIDQVQHLLHICSPERAVIQQTS